MKLRTYFSVPAFRASRAAHGLLFAAVLGAAGDARAALIEPTGNAIPVAPKTVEVSLVTSRGYAADAITLAGLFSYRAEAIDWVSDARADLGAFDPQCGISVQPVMRGGGCKLDLVWYNATVPEVAPAAGDLHVLVPKNEYQALATAVPPGMSCTDPDFCPLATHTNSQGTIHSWVDQIYSTGNLKLDPSYKGGLVGFAIVGDPLAQCTETHYSQTALNTQNEALGQPWIAALTWQSTAMSNAYYLGFEDWPMSAANWANGMNDGDFNDFVFLVSFTSCSGATSTTGSTGTIGTTGASATTGATTASGSNGTTGVTTSTTASGSTGPGSTTGASTSAAASGSTGPGTATGASSTGNESSTTGVTNGSTGTNGTATAGSTSAGATATATGGGASNNGASNTGATASGASTTGTDATTTGAATAGSGSAANSGTSASSGASDGGPQIVYVVAHDHSGCAVAHGYAPNGAYVWALLGAPAIAVIRRRRKRCDVDRRPT